MSHDAGKILRHQMKLIKLFASLLPLCESCKQNGTNERSFQSFLRESGAQASTGII